MPTVVDLLVETERSGTIATIVYNGGSKPGATRPIIPIRIQGEAVYAREPGLPQEKTFKLDKIAKVTLADGRSAESSSVLPIEVPTLPTLETVEQYALLLKTEYEQRGWNVFHDTEEQLFGVGRFFKNGSPKKRPVMYVRFIDRSVEESLDFETGEIVETKKELTGRERPWRVDSERQPQGKSFSKLHEAMEFLAQDIEVADPKGAK